MELDQASSLLTKIAATIATAETETMVMMLMMTSTTAKAKVTLTAEVNTWMMAMLLMTTSPETTEIATTLRLVTMLTKKTMLTTVTTQRMLFEIMNKFYSCQVIFILALNNYGTCIAYHPTGIVRSERNVLHKR